MKPKVKNNKTEDKEDGKIDTEAAGQAWEERL